jgi:hypothetical protein
MFTRKLLNARSGLFLVVAALIAVCSLPAHAQLTYGSPSLNFGNVPSGGASGNFPLQLTNNTGSVVNISGFTLGSVGYNVLPGTCGSSLAPAASCSVTLTLNPSSAGLKADTFSVTTTPSTPGGVSLIGLSDGVCQFAPTSGQWNVAGNWTGDCAGQVVPGAYARAEITGKTAILPLGLTTIGDLYFGSATIQGADSSASGSTLLLLQANPIAWASGNYNFSNMTLSINRPTAVLNAISGAFSLNNALLMVQSGSTVRFGTTSLVSNVSGAGGSIENEGTCYLDGDLTLAVSPTNVFNNYTGGQLRIANADVSITGKVYNDGVVEVAAGRVLGLPVAADYLQGSGGVLQGYGTVNAPGQVLTVADGFMNGSLAFNVAELISGAFVTPTSAAPSTIGSMTVQGKLTLTSNSKVKIRTQGTSAGDTSSIVMQGSGSTLAGELEIEPINSYIPVPGQSVTALTFPGGPPPGATGSFSSVTTSGPGLWLPTYNASNVTVTAAVASTLAIAPSSLSFGQLNVGLMSSPQTVSMVNSGAAPVTFASNFNLVDFARDGFVFGPGTCQGATLQQNDSCTMTVSFFPDTPGVTTVDYADFLLAASNAGPISPASAIATGEGLSLPIDVVPGQKIFPNTPVGGYSGQTFSIVNNTASAGTPVIVASGDFIDYGGCFAINPGQSCSIYVEFQPTVVGPATGSLVITLNSDIRTISLSGTAVPGLSASPTSVNFGSLTSGSSSTLQTVTITKASGIGCLDYNAPTVGGPDAASVTISSNTCGAGNFDSFCTVGLVFNATGGAGARSASVSISGSYGVGCQQQSEASPLEGLKSGTSKFLMAKPAGATPSVTIPLSATVTGLPGAPVIGGAAPPSGFVNSPYTFTFSATGTTPITWGVTSGALPPGLTLSSAGAITGIPTTAGTFTFSVTATNTVGPTTLATSITITQPIVPAIDVNPSSLNFGNQVVDSTSSPQVITVSNTGNGPFDITSITSVGDFAYTSNCPTTLQPNASCTLSVTFTPLIADVRNGRISVNNNASAGNSGINLTGTGVLAPRANMIATPSLRTFGLQALRSTSAPQIQFISNTGELPLQLRSLRLDNTAFALVDPPAAQNPNNLPRCTTSTTATTVPARTSCAIGITFSPTVIGLNRGALQIEHNGSATGALITSSITLEGTGAPASEALIRVSGGLNFTDTVVGGTGTTQSVTVSNNGTINLNVGTPTIVPGNASTSTSDFTVVNRCTAAVVPNGSCTVDVTFTPVGATGAKSATLVVPSNASNAPTSASGTLGINAVSLFGSALAIPQPQVQLSATTIGFGSSSLGKPVGPREVRLTNIGNEELVIDRITLTNAPGSGDVPAFEMSSTASSACRAGRIGVGQSCVMQLTYRAAGVGSQAGVLTITSNAPSSPDRVQLSGSVCAVGGAVFSRFFIVSASCGQ